MLGFITETDLRQADEVFPGIEQFFDALAEKPRTFLELVSQFEHWASRCTRPGARPSLSGDEQPSRRVEGAGLFPRRGARVG